MNILTQIENKIGVGKIFDLSDLKDIKYNVVKSSINHYIKKNTIKKYAHGCYYIPDGNKNPDVFEYLSRKYIYIDGNYIGFYGNEYFGYINNLSYKRSYTIDIYTNLESNIKHVVSFGIFKLVLRKNYFMEVNNENHKYISLLTYLKKHYANTYSIGQYIQKNKIKPEKLIEYSVKFGKRVEKMIREIII